MGGRGGSSGILGIRGLRDSLDFDDFIEQNLSNPSFMKFGRDHSMDEVRGLWYEVRMEQELKDLHEVDIYDAVDQVRDSVSPSVLSGWFRSADSGYKPALIREVLTNSGTLNAGLNIAYENYKHTTDNPMSFSTWLNTPQTLYRGTHGQRTVADDVFMSYTPDRSIAEGFGSEIATVRVRPRDTLGSYQTTSEQEFLIPTWRRK